MPHYHRNCAHCFAPFVYHPAGKDKGKEHIRGLCCSMACKSAYVRAPRVCQVYAGHCKGCSGAFVTRRARDYCKPGCRPSAAPSPARARVCARCEKPYMAANTGGRPTYYCSEACRLEVIGAAKRVHKAKRKAVEKRAKIESVDPFVVFERDRWTCQLCFYPAPKSKRGSYDSDAPELDHIVPLSEGGAHSYENTQCACRSCNIAKGNKIGFESAKIRALLG